MVTSIDSIPFRVVGNEERHDAPARVLRDYRLVPGRYCARASARIPVESELLVFDRDANLFLSSSGRSPSIEFQLDCERTVIVLGNVIGEGPLHALRVRVDAVSDCKPASRAA